MTAMMLMFCCFENGSYRVFGRNPSAEDIFRFVEKYKVRILKIIKIVSIRGFSGRYDFYSTYYNLQTN